MDDERRDKQWYNEEHRTVPTQNIADADDFFTSIFKVGETSFWRTLNSQEHVNNQVPPPRRNNQAFLRAATCHVPLCASPVEDDCDALWAEQDGRFSCRAHARA